MSKVIKYSVDHYRKEGVSEEAFEKFFQEQHLANALPLFKKYGIIKYCVVSRLRHIICGAYDRKYSSHTFIATTKGSRRGSISGDAAFSTSDVECQQG